MAQAKAQKKLKVFRKVDQPMIDAILKDIAEGSPKKHAAESNGITETYFHKLIKQGLIDLEARQETLQSCLVVSLRAIEKKEIKKCRQLIVDSAKGHVGAEWTLTHAYARHFGNNAALNELIREFEELKNNQGIGVASDGEVNGCKAQ